MPAVARVFDIVVSGTLLVLTSPIFAVVAILIKLDSRGPVFFMQERVGKGWRPFWMFKFRKMYDHVGSQGPGVTARRDVRVTRVGAWLERTKLDELPQLINVLRGDMSLVGPRPEIARFTETYRDRWDRVLAVRPGVLGPNQITHRNESELYPEDCDDPEAFYVEHILPGKLEVDAAYAARKSLPYDAWILLRGAWAVFAGMVTRDTIRTQRWQLAYLFGAALLGMATLSAAAFLRLEGAQLVERDTAALGCFGLMLFARLLAFYEFKVHRSIHAYFTLYDAWRICASVAAGTVLGVGLQFLANIRSLSRVVFVIDGVLLTVSMLGISFLIDRILDRVRRGERLRVGSMLARAVWGAAAGAAGTVSMFLGLALAWPGAFARPAGETAWLLLAPFASRLVLFPALLREMRGAEGVVGAITQRLRPVIGHLGLVFVADITVLFFANVQRNFSRLALLAGAALYVLPLFVLLAVRTVLRARSEGDEAPDVVDALARRALIVGDGRETGLFVQAMKHARRDGSEIEAIGIVVENPMHRTRHVEGVPVVGTVAGLRVLIEAREPSVVIVLKNTIGPGTFRRVARVCRDAGVDMRVVPGIMQLFEEPRRTEAERPTTESRELIASGTDLR
jgi:lipopolysaccharide/colanic/teichoic acid biosynthesis glycosyltransferase